MSRFLVAWLLLKLSKSEYNYIWSIPSKSHLDNDSVSGILKRNWNEKIPLIKKKKTIEGFISLEHHSTVWKVYLKILCPDTVQKTSAIMRILSGLNSASVNHVFTFKNYLIEPFC